jgi:hypothetical protein
VVENLRPVAKASDLDGIQAGSTFLTWPASRLAGGRKR